MRPLVREFGSRARRAIAIHVGAGGHAVVWEAPKRAHLVLPAPNERDEEDLAAWSLYDLRKSRWRLISHGALGGFITALVARDCLGIVRRRVARDRDFTGSTRAMNLDCLTCGACCRDNDVVLEPEDVRRFRAAGHPEFARPPYARRSDGKLAFRLLRSQRCRHLLADNRCSIYAIRPQACSTFPAGSESCLYSRELELGLADGNPTLPRAKRTALACLLPTRRGDSGKSGRSPG